MSKDEKSHFAQSGMMVALVAIVAIVALVLSVGPRVGPSQDGVVLDEATLVGDAGRLVKTRPDIGMGVDCVYRFVLPDGRSYEKTLTINDGRPCPPTWSLDGFSGDLIRVIPAGVAPENLVGSARYDIAQEEYVVDGERYVREESREEPVYEERVFEESFALEEELLREEEFAYEALPEPSAAGSIVLEFAEAGRGVESTGCFPLTQSMFGNNTNISNYNNYTINISGCVEMNSNLNLGVGVLFLAGNTELQCNNYELMSTGTLVLKDNAIARDCIIKNRIGTGIRAMDNAQVFDSYVSDTVDPGMGGLWGTTGFGFYLSGNAKVVGSTAEDNTEGFALWQTSVVEESYAEDNAGNGFVLAGPTTSTYHQVVKNSVSRNNGLNGFSLYSHGVVEDSVAEGNTHAGIYLTGSSSVSGSKAVNNDMGFFLFGSSSVSGSIAVNNDMGFFLFGSSSVSGSIAENNVRHGFHLRDSSSVSDSYADQNDHDGFYFAYGSPSFSGTLETRGNARNGITVNSGTVTGTNYAPGDMIQLYGDGNHGIRVNSGATLNLGSYPVMEELSGVNSINLGCGFVNGNFQCGTLNGTACLSLEMSSVPGTLQGQNC